MGDVNPFLKYVIKDDKEDIFHTSAYAKAQNGGSMGAASAQSFADRQKMEQNRTMIRGYASSGTANNMAMNGPRAQAVAPGAGGARPAGARPAGARPMPKPLGLSPKR
jgi:hypothetical protein